MVLIHSNLNWVQVCKNPVISAQTFKYNNSSFDIK